jgi:hypothetical protein
MRKIIAAALTVSSLAGFAMPAAAETVCAVRQQILDSLRGEYFEAPRALGMANDGNVVELLSTGDGGTWTLLVTMPDGISCVIAAGESWEALRPQLALEPET